MNASLTRYTTALLPLFVLVLGVLDAANKAGASLFSWQTILQLLVLLTTTGLSFWLPLVDGPWAGALKTGAAVVGAIASAAIATIPNGGEFTTATLILFLTAAAKAVAVQVGVSIRSDAAKHEDEQQGQVAAAAAALGLEPTRFDDHPDDGALAELDEHDDDGTLDPVTDVLEPNDQLRVAPVTDTPSAPASPQHRAE